MSPDRLVLGVEDETSEAIPRRVYAQALVADTPLIVTDFETAELVKVAANAFLATKISFINSFAEVTETIGGDITVLPDALGHDARIGRKILNAGVGFCGGCLPKDIRALQACTSELGLTHTMGFLAEVDEINKRQMLLCVLRSKISSANAADPPQAQLDRNYQLTAIQPFM